MGARLQSVPAGIYAGAMSELDPARVLETILPQNPWLEVHRAQLPESLAPSVERGFVEQLTHWLVDGPALTHDAFTPPFTPTHSLSNDFKFRRGGQQRLHRDQIIAARGNVTETSTCN